MKFSPNKTVRLIVLLLIIFISNPQITLACENEEPPDPFATDVFDFLKVSPYEIFLKANDHYANGEYEEAIRDYLDVIRLDHKALNSLYNITCCYAMLGKDTLAATSLMSSFQAGNVDIYRAQNEEQFENVRESEYFKATLDSIIGWFDEKEANAGQLEFFATPVQMTYRLHLPENYDSTKAYPLLIGLHGWGDKADNFASLWQSMTEKDFIYAVPAAPYQFQPGPRVGYSWVDWSKGEISAQRTQQLSLHYLTSLTTRLQEKYNPSSTYVMGFSQGAFFSYYLGIINPDIYDGIIPFGGELHREELSDEMIAKAKDDLRVFIIHGNQDQVVEFKGGTEAYELLLKYGYDVTMNEFDGGHSIDMALLNKALDWMEDTSGK